MENGIKFKCTLLVDDLQYLHCCFNKTESLYYFQLTEIISIQDVKTDVIKSFFRRMPKRNCIYRYTYTLKYLTWKSVRPGNKFSTDRCIGVARGAAPPQSKRLQ